MWPTGDTIWNGTTPRGEWRCASELCSPETEIGGDPAAIRDYAQAAESLGYDHLLAYDHVVGANGPGATAKVGIANIGGGEHAVS